MNKYLLTIELNCLTRDGFSSRPHLAAPEPPLALFPQLLFLPSSSSSSLYLSSSSASLPSPPLLHLTILTPLPTLWPIKKTFSCLMSAPAGALAAKLHYHWSTKAIFEIFTEPILTQQTKNDHPSTSSRIELFRS